MSWKSPGCHAKKVSCLEVPCDQLVFPEWINYLLKVPMLLMNGRAFLQAVLQNHLFLSDIKAQLLWAAEENLLPAGVLQVLGQERWQLAKPRRHLLQSHEETRGSLQGSSWVLKPQYLGLSHVPNSTSWNASVVFILLPVCR